jgi:hypothetical protein
MRSENIGGLISMAGSALFLAGGDPTGIAVAASFLIAEIILTLYGHRRAGYSVGCALFAFGDLLAVTSALTLDNVAFQFALVAMALTWSAGSLRAPLAWLGNRSGNHALTGFADALQPLAGIATLALRLPGILTAIFGGSYLGAAAVSCWAIADILVGRVHQSYRILAASLGGRRSR